MRELGIDPPPKNAITEWRVWGPWFQRLRSGFANVQTFTVTFNPTSVAANTTAEQTVTVNGLNTSDIVYVNKPSHTTGLAVAGYRVSAANTLAVTFANVTGSPIDPPSEDYLVTAIRR